MNTLVALARSRFGAALRRMLSRGLPDAREHQPPLPLPPFGSFGSSSFPVPAMSAWHPDDSAAKAPMSAVQARRRLTP